MSNYTNFMRNDSFLAIVCPQVGATSETFIKRQVEGLAPEKTVTLTSSVLNGTWNTGPTKIIPPSYGWAKFTSDVEKDIVQFLDKYNVTRILCQFGSVGTAMVELNSKTLKLPIFVHFHGQDASEELCKPAIVSYYRWMGQNVTGIIAVSKPMADRLVKIGIPSNKIEIIHYGVVAPEVLVTQPGKSPCKFIFVGRLVPKKGVLLLLEAFLIASKSVSGITLDIIGDGSLKSEVDRFVRKHNLRKTVRLHGQQNNEFVYKTLQQSCVYVQHSLTDNETGNAEGLPNTILEAMANGLPIISTFHEGIPEAVCHGRTGFLVKERDIAGMAEFMVKLGRDSELRKSMGFAGRERTLNEGFTAESMLSKIRQFIGVGSEKDNDFKLSMGPQNRPSKILFVNHSIAPYELSGTPISTLYHAIGMQKQEMVVAVLCTTKEVKLKDRFSKENIGDIPVYLVPRFDKYVAFWGTIGQADLESYLSIIAQILEEFKPNIIHINDFVYMPLEILALFQEQGCLIVRNVCNFEELCHRDSPVVTDRRKSQLCSGPNSHIKCINCDRLDGIRSSAGFGLNNNKELLEKMAQRFSAVQHFYSDIVDVAIFTTREFKEHFTKFIKIPEEKVKVVPRGFSFDLKRNSSPVKVCDGVVKFGFIGHITYGKGIDVLLKAFEEISKQEEFLLDIYGPVGDRDCFKWIKELEKKHPKKIKYYGIFSLKDLDSIAQKIHVCIVPSYFDTYNRTVREMLYFGRPVIATDFYGAGIIKNGFNGYKIPIGEYKALENCMLKIISEPGLVAELSRGAIKTEIPCLEDEITGLLKSYSQTSSKKKLSESFLRNKIKLQQVDTVPSKVPARDCVSRVPNDPDLTIGEQIKMAELEKKLNEVYSSRGWKLLNKYYKVRDLILWKKKIMLSSLIKRLRK